MAQNNTNEQATNITARINVMAPVPNIDINYGPYDSVHEAFEAVNTCGAVAKGLTVGVNTESGIQEYWFKNGVTEADLVEKLADQGVTDYNDLENKPKIGNKVLDNQTTLSDIGAASETALTTHTGDSNIHVSSAQKTQLSNLPISMKYGNTAISTFTIDGEKLTIHVGNSDYSFRLTEWVDIADFYVIYGNTRFDGNNAWSLLVNGNYKSFSQVTAEDLIAIATPEGEQNGYTVANTANTQEITRYNGTKVPCNYVKLWLQEVVDYNGLMVLLRTSGSNLPQLDFIYRVGTNDDSDIVADNMLNIVRNTIQIGEENYSINLYQVGGSGTLSENNYGIKITQ